MLASQVRQLERRTAEDLEAQRGECEASIARRAAQVTQAVRAGPSATAAAVPASAALPAATARLRMAAAAPSTPIGYVRHSIAE